MKLAYNGITLGIVQVIESSKTVEYDPTGQDYLWTRYRIAVEAIYNPDDPDFAVAYTTSPTASDGRPNPVGSPVRNQTSSPVYTDIALRHRLMQPRGLLVVDFASDPDPKKQGQAAVQLWLESPPRVGSMNPTARRPCDMANGPLPQEDTIVRDAGDGRTFVVRFVVETCLNECQFDASQSAGRVETPPPPLLSNRWTASMTYDAAGYATRVFAGTAVFRADVLRTIQQDGGSYWAPDAWRLEILPDVPVNSIRYVDELKQAPDGFTYTYSVRDVEQEVSYVDQPATMGFNGNPIRLPGRRPRSIRSISCEVVRQFQTASTREALPAFLNSLQQAAWGFGGGGGGSVVQQAAVTAVARSVAILDTLNTLLPTYSETAVCTIRGTRNSTKTGLLRTAYAVVFGQLSGPLGRRVSSVAAVNQVVPSQIQGAEKAKTTVLDSLQNYLRMTPPGVTFQVRYDAFRRQVQVTVGVEYGGLLDWTSGATIGGMQSMCQNIPEQVIGGTWPFFFNSLPADVNQTVGAGDRQQAQAVGLTLPPLEDAGNLIGTIEDAPGIDLPLAAPPPSYAQPALSPLPPPPPPYTPHRQGTQLFNIIAQSLLGPCGEPALYAGDRATSFRQQGRPPAP